MGQVLERFSSVTEEKKNKEIERIADRVYDKYLKELETAKPPEKSQTSNQTGGDPKVASQTTQTSNQTGGDPKVASQTTQTSNQTGGDPKVASQTTQTSNQTGGDPKVASQTKAREENEKSDEASKYKAKFYRAVCEIVGELNKTFGTTQFKVPSEDNLKKAFEKFHDPDKPDGPTKPVTKAEFQSMLQEILKTESVFAGFGAADALIYMFTVPPAAVLAKQRYFPRAIRNEVLIPGVTSATVYALAKLNKI